MVEEDVEEVVEEQVEIAEGRQVERVEIAEGRQVERLLGHTPVVKGSLAQLFPIQVKENLDVDLGGVRLVQY